MWVHNINPTLFNIGPFEIRYYGLVYVLGFVLALFALEYYRRKKELKLTKDEIYDLLFYQMLGVLIGSRLFEVFFWHPQNYIGNPLKIFYVWEGGMAFHGGLIGIAIATYLFFRKGDVLKRASFGQIADILSIPALIALALGRFANFANAELVGTITNVKWCVVFPNYDSNCRHPSQLYGALKRFIVLGVLLFLNSFRAKKKFKAGFIFWNMVWMLGIGRFIINFFRQDSRLFGLSEGQFLGIIMFLFSIIVLWKYYKKDVKKVFS